MPAQTTFEQLMSCRVSVHPGQTWLWSKDEAVSRAERWSASPTSRHQGVSPARWHRERAGYEVRRV